MKNLPDEEVFKELQGRLQGYEELPDDKAWGKIAGQIPHDEGRWIKWSDRSALTVTILLLLMTYLTANKGHVKSISSSLLASSNKPTGNTSRTDSLQKAMAITLLPKKEVSDSARVVANPSIPSPGNSRQSTKAPLAKGSVSSPVSDQRRKQHQKKDQESTAKPTTSTARSQTKGKRPRTKNQTSTPLPTDNKTSGRTRPSAPAKTTRVQQMHKLNEAVIVVEAEPLSIPVEAERKSESYSWNTEPDDATLLYASPAYPVSEGSGNIGATGSGGKNTIIKPKTKVRHKPSLYFMTMPALVYYDVKTSTTDALYVAPGENDSFTKSRGSIALELGIQGPLYKRLYYHGGISYYHQRNTMTVEQTGVSGFNSNPWGSSTVVTIPRSQTLDIEYRMNNLGLNGGLLYMISLRKFSHQAGASLTWEHGTSSGDNNYDNASSMYFGYRGFYRLEFALRYDLKIFGQPSYSGSFKDDELMDGALSAKYRRIGIGLGLIKDL